jgi:hypothetical protein
MLLLIGIVLFVLWILGFTAFHVAEEAQRSDIALNSLSGPVTFGPVCFFSEEI